MKFRFTLCHNSMIYAKFTKYIHIQFSKVTKMYFPNCAFCFDRFPTFQKFFTRQAVGEGS